MQGEVDDVDIKRPLSPMIGRQSDVFALAQMLNQPETRLVTICGPGGIGKTRLAIEVLEHVRLDFSDGVIFIDLVPVRDPTLISEQILTALGAPLPGSGSIIDAVIRQLDENYLLLALDNMEHLVSGADVLTTILEKCPNVVVLATSRQRLGLASERVLEITPLSTPDQYGAQSIEVIESSESVQLFLQCARAADRTYVLTPEIAPDVAAICRRLDGLPLAIELAASRVAEIPPRLILRNFVRVLPFLERSGNDPEGRHRTLRNAIDWSYQSLSDTEKQLFSRLSIFDSGCSIAGARAVGWQIDDDGDPDREATTKDLELVEILGSLLGKHFLIRKERGDNEYRYDMLETMREFGRERLVESGQERSARDAHAAFFLNLTEDYRVHIRSSDPGPWLDRLNAELSELRSALDWLMTSRPAGDGTALYLSNRLDYFWGWLGHDREGERRILQALSLASDEDSLERATGYLNLGNLTEGDVPKTRAYYEKSLEILRRLDYKVGIAGLLSSLGMSAEMQGEYEQAEAYLDESLQLFQELEFDGGIALCAFHLGSLAERRGQFSTASQHFDTARSLFESLGDTVNALFSSAELGRISRIEGRYLESAQVLTWSLARFKTANIGLGVRHVLAELGWTAVMTGDRPLALGYFHEAINQAMDSSVHDGHLILAIEGIALLASKQNQPELAVELLSSVHQWLMKSQNQRPSEAENTVTAILAQANRILDEEEYRLAWSRGELATIDDTCRKALLFSLSAERRAEEPTSLAATNEFGLTRQERTVLCLIAAGKRNRQIADELSISERTVAVHVQNVLQKMDAENRTHASAMAFHANLCPADAN